MRSLALLAALALLAFQAHADLSPETAGEAPDQEQPGEEDQEVSISFVGAEGAALQSAGVVKKVVTCYCRSRSCKRREKISGICIKRRKRYIFCCS